jgi:hypothetical protein
MFSWFRDLRFYWKNSWDFEKPSGEILHFGVETLRGKELSNKQRVLIGAPFFLVSCLVIIAALVLKLPNLN